VGESEKALARAFEQSRKTCPAILFIDEIESVLMKRSDSGDLGKKVLFDHNYLQSFKRGSIELTG
jgi:SpoVK/Ycf46/Vps4 family AAA+-type ATPase